MNDHSECTTLSSLIEANEPNYKLITKNHKSQLRRPIVAPSMKMKPTPGGNKVRVY